MSAFHRALALVAKDAAASGHEHCWEHRPDQSGNAVTRYQCALCGRWGRRTWGTCGRHVPPILAYVVGKKPDPEWSLGAEPETVPFKREVVIEDPENPEVVVPGWRWRWS